GGGEGCRGDPNRRRTKAIPPTSGHGGDQAMKLFLDTANVDEIKTIKKWGVLSGATTNPSLLAKEHADWELQMKEVCTEVPGDVSLETTEKVADDIYEQGLKLAAVAPNVVVKVVMTPYGLES